MKSGRNFLIFVSVATAIAAAMVFYPDSARFGQTAGDNELWDQWRRLTPAQQRQYVQTFQELSRSPDGNEVLAAAGTFAGMSEAAQQRLRSAVLLLQAALDREAPNRRRDLERLDPPARARQLYDLLSNGERAALHELAVQ
jgi:hypothetical protein